MNIPCCFAAVSAPCHPIRSERETHRAVELEHVMNFHRAPTPPARQSSAEKKRENPLRRWSGFWKIE